MDSWLEHIQNASTTGDYEYAKSLVDKMSDDEKDYGIRLLDVLRMNGFNSDMDYMNRNIKSNFKQADRLNSKYVIIIGEEEVNSNVLTIKDNRTKEEYKVSVEEVVEFFDKNIKE